MTQYLVAGLVSGSIYALAALGLVSTYLSAGVLNFSFGAVAFFVARLFYFLHTQHHWSIAGAALLAIVVVGPVAGLALWAVLFRYLSRQSTLIKVAATIGLSVAIPPLAQLLFGKQPIYSVPGLAPAPVSVYHVLGVSVTLDQVIVLGCLVAVLVLGAAVLRLSSAGLVVRATVDSETMTSLVGTNPQLVGAAVWVVSFFLAGLAGVLLAPSVGLQSDNFTLLTATAFTAVVVARLRHPGWAVLVALAVGVVTSVIEKYVSASSTFAQELIPAIPFGFILVFILVASRGVREAPGQEEASLGAQLAREDELRVGGSGGRNLGRLPSAWVVGVVVLAGLPAVLTGYWTGVVAEGFAYAVVFLSLTLLTGEGGLISLAQVSFAGVGATALAQLATVYGLPPLLAWVLAGLVALPFGLLVGALTVRLGGLYVALITLTLALLMDNLVFHLNRFYQYGAGVPVPRPGFLASNRPFAWFALGTFVVLALFVKNLRRSTSGLAVTASRWSEPAARTLGLSTTTIRIMLVGIAAVIASLGGGLLATYQGTALSDSFTTQTGLVWLSVVVALGIRSDGAAVLAGLSFTVIPALVAKYLPASWTPVPTMLFGLAAIGMVRQPDGIVADVTDSLRRLRRRALPGLRRSTKARAPRSRGAEEHAVSSPRPVGAALEARGITARFGGLVAVDDVSLSVPAGTIVGLVGPNGAGKSTLFGVLSGLLTPSRGQVYLKGEDVSDRSPQARARRGLSRTFQHPEVFSTMTVREHLELAYRGRAEPRRVWTDLLGAPSRWRTDESERSRIDALLASLDLAEVQHRRVAALPLGFVRRTEVARALATQADILLLDEPSSGLDARETQQFGEVLRQASTTEGCAMVVVEHDIDFVLGLSRQVFVMDFGRLIAAGSPDEIRRSPAVQAAYLGTGEVP